MDPQSPWPAQAGDQPLRAKIDQCIRETSLSGNTKNDFVQKVWPALQRDYNKMVKFLEDFCRRELERLGIRCKVSGRAKALDSIRKTLDRRENHRQAHQQGQYGTLQDIFHDMHDLAGIKIVVDFPSDDKDANSFIQTTFQQIKEPTEFRDRPVGQFWHTWFGAYKCCNHHVSLKSGTREALSEFYDVMFEIQCTNRAEELYNELAHPLLYKGDSGPPTSKDEIFIDLMHGISLCYNLGIIYMEDKLRPHPIHEALGSPLGSKDVEDLVKRSGLKGTIHSQQLMKILETAPEDCRSSEDVLKCLIERLERIIPPPETDVRNERPIEKADAWIREKCFSPKHLEIERLSGDLLPMDRCYINLAIVKDRSKNAGLLKEGDTGQQASPFSLRARLKLETPDNETDIPLPNLFEPRKTRDGQTRPPSRILIRGRAGVGKTTLCKKIVYEFTHGTMWRDLFDRVLWVPLRNLKLKARRQIAGYNFGNLFCHEYFSQHPEAEKLADALWHATKAKSGRSLFILDGLDEVLQGLDGDMWFLEELLNQPNVVITSRPNAMLPKQLDPLHLEVETIGFHPNQVTAYVENAFTDQATHKPDLEKIAEVRRFFLAHPLVQDLVRIPIQLDAFCYAWDSFRAKAGPATMTAVYRDIVQSLSKKDAVNLDKRSQRQMQVARKNEINKAIKSELHLLEALAFTGLCNDVIDFEPQHRDAISEHFNSHDESLLLDEILGRVSFLRTSNPSMTDRDRNYHFLHLTFQEYFAARYFVQQWEAQKPLRYLNLGNEEIEDIEPTAFLQQHKYYTRYDIFWRFVSGLLSTMKVSGFFSAIEQEPLDLLGPTHQRLVMNCLSEVDSSTNLPNRRKLEATLLQWILFECEVTGSSFLARESECPDSVVSTALESKRGRLGILKTLVSPHAHLSAKTIKTLVTLLKDENKDIRSKAAIVLGSQSQLPQETVSALVAMLKDKEGDVQSNAINALGSQSQLPQEAISALVAMLKDKERDAQSNAAEALRSRSQLRQETDCALVAALVKDEEWFIRSTAAEALRSQSPLSQEAVSALVAMLKDEDEDVRWRAASALGGQSQLPQKAVSALVAALKDKDGGVRWRAADALGSQSQLPQEAVYALVAALVKDESGNVRLKAAKALKSQSPLSQEAVSALVAMLKDEDKGVRWRAAEALRSQSPLSQKAVSVLVAVLKDEDEEVRWRVATSLVYQPQLLDITFEAIGLSEPEKSASRPSIYNIQLVEALYGIWLQRSFEEHLSLYIDNRREACIVNQQNWLRTACFDDQSQHEEFLNALYNGRQLWAYKWQGLWGNCN